MVEADEAVAQAEPGPLISTETVAPFEAFWMENYRYLYRLARRMGATESEVEDVVNHAMAAVLRKWNDIENPRAYASRAVLTSVLKLGRWYKKHVFTELGPKDRVAEPQHDGARVWAESVWVDEMLNLLNDDQRAVMEGVLDGKTSVELSEALGKSPGAIRKTIERARIRLIAALNADVDAKAEEWRDRGIQG